MTYLLKSEVDLQEERGRYEALNAKFETLNSLLGEDSVIPGVGAIRGGTSSVGGGTGDGVGGGEHGGNVYGTSSDNGIAYTEDDLYPSQFMSPVRSTTNTNTNTITTPHSTNNTTTYSTNNTYNTSRHDAPSPSLKMIAQQYANDDLYPIPIDSEHSLHYDDYDYEASFVVSDVKSTPIRGTISNMNTTNNNYTTNTTNTATPTIHGAKFTSTPARFHEQIATLTNPEHKASKLAMNAPPNMVLSTPVRSVHSSVHNSVYGNTSGGVSSTAPTPQVMPYNTNLAANLTRDYTALGVYSTNTTPNNNTSNTSNNYYTQLNSPAVYVDAYSSYLPSAPTSDKLRGGSGIGSGTSDVMSTPARQVRVLFYVSVTFTYFVGYGYFAVVN